MKKILIRITVITLTIFMITGSAGADAHLVPGGQIIGLALADSTLTVVSIDRTLGKNAADAGMH